MKRLLITGFEPFGTDETNSSLEAVMSLPSEVGGYALTKLCLPVVFGEAAGRAIREAESLAPEAILCIGQARGREAITPEMVAVNLRYADIPDNGGNLPKDELVLTGGDSAYFSTLPARKMAEAIERAGISSRASLSAGAYVCNDLFYTLLAHYRDTGVRVGFIHVPVSTDSEGGAYMEKDKIVRGLIAAIEAIDSAES